MKNILKRSLSVLLAITIIFSSTYVGINELDFSEVFSIKADAASVSDLTFILNGDGASYYVSDCRESASGEIVIPDTYKGLPVTEIGIMAFNDSTELETIEIPDTVTTIKEQAFAGCQNLTSINIPDGVTYIPYMLFELCTSLTSIVIPDGVTGIDRYAFYGCSNLSTVTIPASVVMIGEYAFGECESLRYIFYTGDSLQKTMIIVSRENNILNNAFWHYNSTDHTKSDWIIKEEPECMLYGCRYKECTACKKVLASEDIPPIGHIESDWIIGENADCDTDGYKYKRCTVCGAETDFENISAWGHTEGDEWHISRNPTCTELGKRCKKCIICGYELVSETVSATGHTTVIDEAVVPSCTTAGKTEGSHCSVCNTVIKAQETIPATGHSYSTEWTVDVLPTCSKEGSKHKTCLNCGDAVPETIASLGHDYSVEWTIDKIATCTEEGSKSHRCLRCGSKSDVTVIPISSAKHIYSDWVTEKEATCYSTGKRVKICVHCGDTVYDLIPATEHSSSSWIIDKKATVNAKGKKYKECTECGEVIETATIKQLKCSKPKLSKIENVADGIKITWGKISGADKYDVYRKTGSSGKYSKIATTSKTYYTDKKASSGKKYYYYVKAVNEAGSSSASSSKSIYHLADTTLSTPKSTKEGITLKWKKVIGADGYMVYRKTGSGSYSKITTVKGNSKVTYTDKKAKKGKTYTYKIKAYKSKTTSAYSNAKRIKDKY